MNFAKLGGFIYARELQLQSLHLNKKPFPVVEIAHKAFVGIWRNGYIYLNGL